MSLTFIDVIKQLNIQEEFSSEQTHNKTENANLSCGEPKTPTVGVFVDQQNRALKAATVTLRY